MTLLNNPNAVQFTPKYVTLAHELMKEISERRLMPGDRLATESELMEKYNISRITVRQALELLLSEGYISRQRARGTFVKRAIEPAKSAPVLQGTVLLISNNDQNSFREDDVATLAVQRAMEQALVRRGFAVQILTLGQNAGDDRARLEMYQAQPDLKGILTIGPCLEPDSDEGHRVPIVTTCTFHADGYPWIGQDASQASHDLVDHLIEYGHRRIAMICGSWVDGIGLRKFADGFLHAHQSNNIAVDRTLMLHAYPNEDLTALATQLLDRPNRPTAVFCENWLVCHGVIAATEALGLRIPDDISIVVYGQNAMEITSPCHITAYVPNITNIGEAATDLLLKLIAGDTLPEDASVSIPGQLIIGQSVRRLTPELSAT